MPKPPSRHRRRPDPRWLAAPLLGAAMLAGAMSGEAIGSAPVIARHTEPPPIAIRAAAFERSPARSAPARRLPDHYPLVTPTGTVPVAALASHGRFRDLEEGRLEQRAQLALDDQWVMSEDEIDRLERWEPEPRLTPQRTTSPQVLAAAEEIASAKSAPAVSVARGAGAPRIVLPVQAGEAAPPARNTALPVED